MRYLGYEKIAELKDIYVPTFKDTPQSQGFIALATGLGIMKTDGQNFEPGKSVTRAEAAGSIVQALGNKR
ncbi:MAG: S-layer homology domain-containing protein [Peptococcaceae bacterium]|nr:S-layer homology domain-containing protein [Peptococcaceae bacterium]